VSAKEANYEMTCSTIKYPNSAAERRLLDAIWWYFFSKSIELLDTVWMVLRKKNNQITFLHVFHHSSMVKQ
jgi:elongation of very long chain fatty acids protein 4